MSDRMIAPDQFGDDKDQERSLRPKSLNDFVGQEKIKENLSIAIEAASHRNESLDHALFAGPPGLGKTTLANIIASEMDSHLHITSGPILDKPSDLAGLLTSLEEGDVLFIDEIHRLSRTVEEYLYSAMEDYRLDIMLESGPTAKSINLPIQPFTLVGATTRAGMLSAPLRDRFGLQFRLEHYEIKEINQIIHRSADLLEIKMTDEAADILCGRCRGTPRIANRILRRCRDVAQVRGEGFIDKKVAERTLEMIGIDPYGLDEMDRRILKCIAHQFNGGPVGLGTLGSALDEESETIEEVYEPYLIQNGFLKRTSKGRMATTKTFDLLNLKLPHTGWQEELF
tara:strand:- start:9 stop:1031 length:1023 start_codon:yes stop_codon:yes gene_type:complete